LQGYCEGIVWSIHITEHLFYYRNTAIRKGNYRQIILYQKAKEKWFVKWASIVALIEIET